MRGICYPSRSHALCIMFLDFGVLAGGEGKAAGCDSVRSSDQAALLQGLCWVGSLAIVVQIRFLCPGVLCIADVMSL